MFSSAQSLPPLSALTSEHPPLRLTAPIQRSFPTGECRFILLHPSVHNQRCACQHFYHNGKPGLSCECGHQSCYHVHSQTSGESSPTTPMFAHSMGQDPTVSALIDRVLRLEEALENERRARQDELQHERRLREKDIRIVREALHPFYRAEREMRQKVVELEDRIEGNYDEQVWIKQRVIEIDDAAISLEKRLDELDAPKPKRRRFSRQLNQRSRKSSAQSEPVTPINPVSSRERFSQSIFATEAPQLTSPPSQLDMRREDIVNHDINTTPSSPLHPRSSGILDTTQLPRPLPLHLNSPFQLPSSAPSPRSSGILELGATTSGPHDSVDIIAHVTTTTPSVDSAITNPNILVSSAPSFHGSVEPSSEYDQLLRDNHLENTYIAHSKMDQCQKTPPQVLEYECYGHSHQHLKFAHSTISPPLEDKPLDDSKDHPTKIIVSLEGRPEADGRRDTE